MKPDSKTGSRAVFIGVCIVLMASAVYIVGESLRQEKFAETAVKGRTQEEQTYPDILQEAGAFRYAENALAIGEQPRQEHQARTLSSFYQRRAYPGAPPKIPHLINTDMSETGNSCLSCHESGGFAAKFKAFAPITPHPEMINCRQCHVPETEASLFRETTWKSVSPPRIKRSALPGSPPAMPHGLQMRENCLSCHGGTGALKEIRSSHPERVNCRQCHMALQDDTLWSRALGKNG